MFSKHTKLVSFFLFVVALLPMIFTAMHSGKSDVFLADKRTHGKAKLNKFVPGELLVKYKSSFAFSQQRNWLATSRLEHLGTSGSFHRMAIADKMSVQEKVLELRNDPAVELVQPNYYYHTNAVPNDPQFGQLWALKNTAQAITGGRYTDRNPGLSGNDMNMEAAWNIRTDCGTIIVAIIDTGVNYNHQDLAANMWNGGAMYPNHGYNFVDKNNNPMDLNGHGTHVAGTIGAAGNDGAGGVGICWKASIMALRAMDASGSGTTDNVAAAVRFAADNGAKVINMSLGSAARDLIFEDAIKYARSKGVLVVVAAGNSGANNDTPTNTEYPCGFDLDNIICVAALDQAYGLASFSNFGLTTVDVGAPGTNILSSVAGQSSLVRDTFNTGGVINWTVGGTTNVVNGFWGFQRRSFNVGGQAMLLDVLGMPAAWDRVIRYPANANSNAFKVFNLANLDSVMLDFLAFIDVAANDVFRISINPGGGSPFGAGGIIVDEGAGTSQGAAVNLVYELQNCRTATCAIGFSLQSNAGTDFGVAALLFDLEGLRLQPNVYSVYDGTSMATPHVAGLAALVWAQNPSYNYLEVAKAIKESGRAVASLAGKSTTGKAVDANSAVRYIAPPSGVSVEGATLQ